MNIIFLVIIIFILILIFIVIVNNYLNKNNIATNIAKLDLEYFAKKIYKKIIGQHIININTNDGKINTNNIDNKKTNKILIITCDNRPNIEFVK